MSKKYPPPSADQGVGVTPSADIKGYGEKVDTGAEDERGELERGASGCPKNRSVGRPRFRDGVKIQAKYWLSPDVKKSVEDMAIAADLSASEWLERHIRQHAK
jgi:hypothetical protein